MTIVEVLEQAKALSLQERKELVKLLVDTLDQAGPELPRQRSLRELRGLGKEIWEGVDVEAYVNEMRDEWDDHP